jgi:transcriptional regulator with XRE-family HTH domain
VSNLANTFSKGHKTMEREQQSTAAERMAVEMAATDVPRGFGELVCERREAAQLSISELARQAKVTRATIRNVEEEITTPCRGTMRRLASVPALKLSPVDLRRTSSLDESTTWQPDAWFAPQYKPLQIAEEMAAMLNGPGGHLDQTYLYVDPQSASDWYKLCNREQYTTAFRADMPLDKVAERLLRESQGAGLDMDALGCGDGKTETVLAQRLADRMPQPADLRLYLLDISGALLSTAYRHACDSLASRRVPVFALHANFHDIARLPVLFYRAPGVRRLRIYGLFGGTLANLLDEQRFFRDLAQCAQPGDLSLVDIQIVRAPVEQPDEIRRRDVPIRDGMPPSYADFLGGPLLRHCRGLKRFQIKTELRLHLPVPGSYSVDNVADLQMHEGPPKRFLVWRVKRYDPARLGECLTELGWEPIQTWRYGPEKLAAVMLLRRRG